MRSRGLGVWVAGQLVPLLLYADDIVLMASSPSQLRTMLHVLSEYAATWRFDINHKKSSVLISGHAPKSLVERMKAERWLVDGDCIKVVDSYKYLGLDFGPLVQGK